MSPRAALRGWREPAAVFGVALLGSFAVWGRLWVTSPTSRAVCGCGDPSLFQWFLAWPAHALTTGHSLVFSRDLFHPHGINLLANTSVLALGLPLAPFTWLGGPVLTQNVALLLSIPVAAWTMSLFLRRVTDSLVARVVLSLLYGFSPYVIASLAVSHLMTAWIGVLPLIALGVVDAASAERRRSRRGQVLLAGALVLQFFLSTELLLLAALVAAVVLVVLAVTAAATRANLAAAGPVAVRVAVPVGVAVAVLALPAAYALWGPRSFHGNIWGAGLNPFTGGTSWQDLVRPHAVGGGLTGLSGYTGKAVVQLQYVGWGLVLATAAVGVWRWRDGVARTAAITSFVCLVLSLSPLSVPWAPWRWLGRLPVLEDVLQFRIVVFAMLAAIVAIARGVGALEGHGRAGLLAAGTALAVVVVPVAAPVAASLPLRTVHVGVPRWWREASGPGVVLAYPYPNILIQSPLTWQASGGFPVAMLGGSGPQGAATHRGVDAAATAVLNDLTSPGTDRVVDGRRQRGRSTATSRNAALVRTMVVRDGVTEVVVPVELRGRYLVTGAPSVGAAAFFVQVLGVAPAVEDGAWVFHVDGPLPAPHLVAPSASKRCERLATATSPRALAPCLGVHP